MSIVHINNPVRYFGQVLFYFREEEVKATLILNCVFSLEPWSSDSESSAPSNASHCPSSPLLKASNDDKKLVNLPYHKAGLFNEAMAVF